MPAQNAVRPARAPLLMPRLAIGDFTEPEVMLTMRPNLRSHMPSTVTLINMIGVSMLALTAFCQSSTDHSRKSPCGGPPGFGRDVAGHRRHLGASFLADLLRRLFEGRGGARGDRQFDPGAPQRH